MVHYMFGTPRAKVFIAVALVGVMVIAQLLVFVTQEPSNNDIDDIGGGDEVGSTYESEITFHMADDSTVIIGCQVADTIEERETGLMYVSSLPEHEGMLFDLGESRNVTLWMKNVEIPLDMIFVDKDMRIINIEEASVELPDTPDSELTRYYSGQPVLYIIETNMGFCSTHGIEAGTEIDIIFNKLVKP